MISVTKPPTTVEASAADLEAEAGPNGGDAVAVRPAGLARGALAGLVAAGLALGVGEFVAGAVKGSTAPIVGVGNWVIDHVPPSVKTFAIRTFGTHDKQALIVGTTISLLVFAAFVGAVATRRLRLGLAGVGVFGLVGILATLSRPTADLADALPSLLGALAAAGALFLLLRPAASGARRAADPDTAPTPALLAGGLDRRHFLLAAGATAAIAATAGGVGRALQKRVSVVADRARLILPKPRSAAKTLPAGIDTTTPGITPFITSNADFYRVDTALVVPQVSPASWKLRIHGMVDKEISLSFDDLMARPMIERDLTLVCVSNEVGGHYAGTARWLGVPLADLLKEAGVKAGANQLVSTSVDGFTAGSPLAAVLDGRDAMVAIGMNGEPLPVVHGFPARLVVPGLYGYVSATKWVTDLEVTTFDRFDGYWVKRSWAQQAPLQTMSRIDTPRGLQQLPAGRTPIAGVAWATHTGISKVEVQIDGGAWQTARLADTVGPDTWVQWVLEWDATPGTHNIVCRATDGAGHLQTEQRAAPIPSGATGWHQIVALVS